MTGTDWLTGIPVVETPNLPADTMIYSSGAPIGILPGIYEDTEIGRRVLYLGARPVPNLASIRLACLLDLSAIAADARKRVGLTRRSGGSVDV
jgi:hypothetical protein